ncbi:MAG: D-alanine--D-alanine ligase family protein [Candidatus Promineifilaceae bacterium]
MMSAEESGQRKLRVGVVFGGRSGEHEVSLMSARSVITALDRDKYEVIEIGISKDGRWLAGEALAQLQHGETNALPATLLPDPQTAALMQLDQDQNQATNLSTIAELDVIIPILHGTYGEDGTLQGLLELAGLPYTGAGVVGSAVGMDKAIFKYVMAANDIPVLDWKLVTSHDWESDPDNVIATIEDRLDYPVFTKPANLGSSVGISKCSDRTELLAGLDDAFRYDRRAVVEQGIDARELEVAVLGNDDPLASIVGEIRPRRAFYDYVAKYLAAPGSEDESELLVPADIDAATAEAVRKLAVRAYKAIDCAGMGRVDLLLDKTDGRLYMNEINTIPGFTTISMYPKLWQESGLSYPALLDRLIELAVERHEQKHSLETSFRSEPST